MSQAAAAEISPGTWRARGERSLARGATLTVLPSERTAAPIAPSRRSVWSRVGPGCSGTVFPAEEGAVAAEDGEERLRRQQAGQQAHGGAGVAALQHAVRLAESVPAAAADAQGRLVPPAPIDAQGAEAVERGHAVSRSLEALDHRLAIGDSVEYGGALGARLLPGGNDGAANGSGRGGQALHRAPPPP